MMQLGPAGWVTKIVQEPDFDVNTSSRLVSLAIAMARGLSRYFWESILMISSRLPQGTCAWAGAMIATPHSSVIKKQLVFTKNLHFATRGAAGGSLVECQADHGMSMQSNSFMHGSDYFQ